MNTSGFFLGPHRDLTKDELESLTDVEAGFFVSERACTKLEMLDLVEKGLSGWKLTQAGEHRLAAKR
jgi:hypothetical protein